LLKKLTLLRTFRNYKDEINFNFRIRGAFDDQPIEPGIFLCYVENAFKHGLQPEEKAFIYINIDISQENKITFKIENSIPVRPFGNISGGFGLKSNQERLHLTYPDKYTIDIKKNETYKVELTVNTNEGNYSR